MQDGLSFIKTFIDRISDILNIFDFSYLISGLSCVFALLLGFSVFSSFSIELSSKYILPLVVIGYILGLLCFTIGRWVRKGGLRADMTNNKFNTVFEEAVKSHNLGDYNLLADYFNDGKIISSRHLYLRLWAEIRQQDELKPSLSVINRYWVMAATYDGLAVSMFVWLLVLQLILADSAKNILQNDILMTYLVWIRWGLGVLFITIATLCWSEAQRYSKHQTEELVATLKLYCYSKTIH